MPGGREDVGGLLQQVYCQASNVVNQLQVFEFRLVSVNGQDEVARLFAAETEFQRRGSVIGMYNGVILAVLANPKAWSLGIEVVPLVQADAFAEINVCTVSTAIA